MDAFYQCKIKAEAKMLFPVKCNYFIFLKLLLFLMKINNLLFTKLKEPQKKLRFYLVYQNTKIEIKICR